MAENKQKAYARIFATARQAEAFANSLARKAAITELRIVPFPTKLATRFLVVARFAE